MSLIYTHYGKALHGVVLGIIKNEQYAEDVLQEAFVKIWNAASTYDAKKSRLFTWMLSICRNTALDKMRSKGFKAEKEIQSDESYVSDREGEHSTNPDTIGVSEMANVLPENEKELIDLIYFQGFSHRAAADETALPLGTVKTRIRKALQTLRHRFKE